MFRKSTFIISIFSFCTVFSVESLSKNLSEEEKEKCIKAQLSNRSNNEINPKTEASRFLVDSVVFDILSVYRQAVKEDQKMKH